MKKLQCSILTPERYLFEGEAAFAVVQAYDGEMGFLVDHSPLMSELGSGEVRIYEGQDKQYFVVEGGIVEIKDNKLIILAESAMKKDELNAEEIENRLKVLSEQDIPPFSKERFEIQAESARLKIRLKVAKR